MTRAEQHNFDWHQRHDLALTVACPYCHAPAMTDCVGPAGEPLTAQPSHVVREIYASKESGEPLLMVPDPEPEEPPPAAAPHSGVVTRQRDTCSHCGARLLWAKTRNDVAMPLDAEPSAELGNVLVSDELGALRANVVGKKSTAAAMREAGHRMHVHHAVTCAFASRWHKRK